MSFSTAMKALNGLRQKRTANESLDHEWTGLQARWLVSKAGHDPADPEIVQVDGLITKGCAKTSSKDSNWSAFNLAEQLASNLLSSDQLSIEFGVLLDLAKQRKLASVAFHEANKPLFPPTADKVGQAHAAYLALLHDLQSNHVEQRFRRKLDAEACAALFNDGRVLAIFVTVVLSVLSLQITIEKTNIHGFYLFLAATSGCTGAYFSRMVGFLTAIAEGSVSYQGFLSNYVKRVLRLRMLYGTFGAVIFYLMMKGGIIGGAVFPEASALKAANAVPQLDSNTARLLIWCFIAGFSERLIPDTLLQTESKAKPKPAA